MTVAKTTKNYDNESTADILKMIFKSKILNYRKIGVKIKNPDLDSVDHRVAVMGYVGKA